MLATLTLVVLVATNEPSVESALVEAVHDALGDGVRISVRTAPLPPDERALAALAALPADVIATIAWSADDPRRATIRLYQKYQASSRSWLSREVEFSEPDAIAEQARTLGFALASMLPEATTEVASIPEPEAEQQAAAYDPPPSNSRSRASIDTTANAGVALDGPGDGFGGTVGAQYDLSPRLGLRADLGFRAGHLERIEMNTFLLDLAPGIAWRAADRPWGAPFAVELRLAVAARYQSLASESGVNYGAENRVRWLPGLRAGVAGLWLFSNQWALLTTAALDSTFGENEFLRQGTRVRRFEPFALLMQLGVRARL